MAHTIEPASSGRAKCRGCGKQITKGELRFGERLPNPFADEGDMTLWFHLTCAAYKRPASLAEVLSGDEEPEGAEVLKDIENIVALKNIIDEGVAHPRLQRVNGAERAPSGRAKCRACKETIPKDSWRIALVFFEEGMFNASGFIHVGCVQDYFESKDIVQRVHHFSPELDDAALDDLAVNLS